MGDVSPITQRSFLSLRTLSRRASLPILVANLSVLEDNMI